MAEDSVAVKDEGEVDNPKLEEAPAATPAADGGRPTSPAASFPTFSVNIWPPSQRTRDAILNRLVENLSTPSVLSKRYGTLPPEEAAAIARVIEEEAFAVASASASGTTPTAVIGDGVASAEAAVDEGIEILHVYSKEISRRMIDSVKTKGSNVSSAPTEVSAAGNGGDVMDSVPKPPISGGEEITSEQSEFLAA